MLYKWTNYISGKSKTQWVGVFGRSARFKAATVASMTSS